MPNTSPPPPTPAQSADNSAHQGAPATTVVPASIATPGSRQRLLTLSLLACAALLALAWAVLHYFSPSPPRSVTLSSGAPDGAYAQFALKYQDFFAANGVTLKLQNSSGSVQNLERLQEDGGETSIGLVQGGLGPLALNAVPSDEPGGLRSLAVVNYEPVWVFSHQLDLSAGLGVLAGKRVGVGLAGSGNEKLALDLLQAYGIGPQQAIFVTEGTSKAAQMLSEHTLDALIFVASAQAPAVVSLLQNPGIQLTALDHVEGLARRFPYLQPIVLRRGSVDFTRNLPPRDTALLATSTQLVIRDDLHPALAYLMLEAASQIHKSPSLFSRPGEFPNLRGADFPVADEAERYFKNGRPFLQRYLPFWAANFVQRLIVIMVPLLAIAFPVFKAIPGFLEWRQMRRIFRRYGELKFLERDIASRKLSATEEAAAHSQLDRIDAETRSAKFSLDISDRVYTLRQHVDYVRKQLDHFTPPATQTAPGTAHNNAKTQPTQDAST